MLLLVSLGHSALLDGNGMFTVAAFVHTDTFVLKLLGTNFRSCTWMCTLHLYGTQFIVDMLKQGLKTTYLQFNKVDVCSN